MSADVDVVIVNWNSGGHLAACLDALSGFEGRITVVDNASVDGSEAACDRPGVEPVRAGRNLGFGAGCNLGARSGQSGMLLFLNPDTVISPEAIRALAATLEACPGAGAAGPALTDRAGRIIPTCSHFPRPQDLLGRMVGADRIGLVRPHFYQAGAGPVDQVMGACLMVRRSAFERLGGFDERFFLYFEEVDLLRRLKNTGASTLYVPAVTAVHEGHGSSGQISGTRMGYWLVSRGLYAALHCGRWAAPAIIAGAVTVEPLARAVALAIAGRYREIPGALAAHLRYATRILYNR